MSLGLSWIFLDNVLEQDVNWAPTIYQDTFDIHVVVLHSDDHGVIIMREDSDDISSRKVDVNSLFSLLSIGEPRGNHIHS